ncbi:MAG: glutamyl-tRNA reductase, partial [Maribacter sp.]|nr:glutamyl-tRNA reductase [Maribacter sp.]
MGLISHYKVITVTHHNLQLNEIANFYVQRSGNEELSSAIDKLKLLFNVEECIYLETCNRVSYIIYTEELVDNAFLKRFFHFINPELDNEILDSIAKYVTCYSGESAINHVFELASSMDSLIVGEREIFRQFRSAYDFAKEEGHAKDYLRLLEKAAVKTAKEVYHSTAIGEKALSIVSLAIQALKERKLPDSSRILLVGSGETNSLVAKFLKKYNYAHTAIYNRSLDNAKELSSFLNAKAYHISELSQVNADFDVIFICTAAN